MTRYLKLSVCLTATLTAAALAQTIDQPETSKTSSPVAFVYVSTPTGIDAFASASNGRLAAVPGSPFAGTVNSMSVNRKYLFGAGVNATDITTFSIGSNGVLKQVSEINAQKYNPDNCGGMGPLQIDYAGTTLYNQVNAPCQSGYQSFHIEANGELQFLAANGSAITTKGLLSPLSPVILLGIDSFAYQMGIDGPGPQGLGGDPSPIEVFYQRMPNGALQNAGNVSVEPGAKNPVDLLCPFLLAGDPSDHLAIAWHDLNSLGEPVGSDVLVPYTAHGAGNLSTTSTIDDIPSSDLPSITAMSISPSGELLVVGGKNGFELFHFNGPNPITPYTGALETSDQFVKFGWDGHNHLYALSVGTSTYQLRVYTVTSTSFKEEPGSPLTVPGSASSLIVRALD
jgi:hypothetical protein